MKILQVESCSLTNFEVHSILRQELILIDERSKQAMSSSSSRPKEPKDDHIEESLNRQHTSTSNVLTYLEKCYPSPQNLNEAAIAAFLQSISRFKLKDEEVLQILNLMPCDPVFFYGMFKDCYKRFSEEEVDELCTLVKRHLLMRPQPADAPAAIGTEAPPTEIQSVPSTSALPESTIAEPADVSKMKALNTESPSVPSTSAPPESKLAEPADASKKKAPPTEIPSVPSTSSQVSKLADPTDASKKKANAAPPTTSDTSGGPPPRKRMKKRVG